MILHVCMSLLTESQSEGEGGLQKGREGERERERRRDRGRGERELTFTDLLHSNPHRLRAEVSYLQSCVVCIHHSNKQRIT